MCPGSCAPVEPRRASALSAFVFICGEVAAEPEWETAGGGGLGGRTSPSPSVPSPPPSMPAALTPIPNPPRHPPLTTFLWGASYKPTIYLHYAPEIAICRFAGKK